MHCKSCDYPLWNLTARQCPECGAPFKPGDFEFVPNAVRFCCPHCEQEYYGATEKGHLDPDEFTCVECGQSILMDEMILRPAVDVSDSQTRPGVMPWFEREHRGRCKAFFQTIGMAMFRPQQLINGVPADSSVGQALVYAFLTTLSLFMIGGLIPGVLWLLAYYGIGSSSGLFSGGFWWFSLFWIIPIWFMTFFGILGLFVFWPMTTHLFMRLTGGCRYPIDRTIHAFTYSAGANAISAIPCIGFMFGWIWWLISAILMVKSGQKVHGGRATLAVTVFPICGVLIVGTIYVVAIWGFNQMTNAVTGGMGMAPSALSQQTSSINMALVSSYWSNSNAAPQHVIENVLSNQIYAYAGWGGSPTGDTIFCHPDSDTTNDDIPVGENTLQDFLDGNSSEKLKLAASVLESMPDGVVAYRFGDYIFTYSGATLNSMDSQFWNMVMLPDPDVNGVPKAKDTIHIAKGDYTVIEVTYDQLPTLLQQQNQYRATLGLAALPDLMTITHDNPAVDTSQSGGGESQD